jgi:hypothetical protein
MPAALNDNPHYILLAEHVSRLEHISKDYPEELKRLREELDQLHASRKDFEDDMTVRWPGCNDTQPFADARM